MSENGKSPEGTVTREGLWREQRLSSEKTPRHTSSFTGRHYDGMLLSTPKISFREGKLPTSPVASPGFVEKDGCTASQVNRHHASHMKILIRLLVLNPNS